VILLLVTAVIGFPDAWRFRLTMNPDGISYLDMADALYRGDWSTAANGYWSPLYPAILGAWLRITRPGVFNEAAAVHIANYVIYLLALLALASFLKCLLHYTQTVRAGRTEQGARPPDGLAVYAIGFALFLWTTIQLVSLGLVSPDVLSLVFFYLALALLVRIRDGQPTYLVFALLGAALGLGYLAKAHLLPIGVLILVVAAWGARTQPHGFRKAALASLVFLLVAGPWIVLLSTKYQRLTLSESPRLNYIWWSNSGYPSYIVHGYSSVRAKKIAESSALHPIRQRHQDPMISEFALPDHGSYPPWSDPTYWYEGINPEFDLQGYLVSLKISFWRYVEVVTGRKLGILLVALFVVAALWLLWKRTSIRWDVGPYLFLLVPAIAGLVMFALVVVETRYVVGFLTIVIVACLASLRLPQTLPLRGRWFGLVVWFSAVCLILLSYRVPVLTGRERQQDLVQKFRDLGVPSGAGVGVIGGPAGHEYWARLAHLQIIAEIPEPDDVRFWELDPEGRARVLEIFAQCGAVAVLAKKVPQEKMASAARPEGWIVIADSPDYLYVFKGKHQDVKPTPRRHEQ
jgi:hypothetical protein